MKRMTLRDEMVDVDGDGYYKVDILLTSEDSNEGYARIPGLGRVLVYRKMPEYSFQVASFAWYVKGVSQTTIEEAFGKPGLHYIDVDE